MLGLCWTTTTVTHKQRMWQKICCRSFTPNNFHLFVDLKKFLSSYLSHRWRLPDNCDTLTPFPGNRHLWPWTTNISRGLTRFTILVVLKLRSRQYIIVSLAINLSMFGFFCGLWKTDFVGYPRICIFEYSNIFENVFADLEAHETDPLLAHCKGKIS